MTQFEEKSRNFFTSLKEAFNWKENNVINAHDAYMIAKYGAPVTEEDLFNETIKTINQLIKTKVLNSFDCAVIKNLCTEIAPYYNDLVEYYEHKGYTVYFIDTNSTIDGRSVVGINSPMIIITWGNFVPTKCSKKNK